MNDSQIFINVSDEIKKNEAFHSLIETAANFANDQHIPIFILDKPLVGEPDDYFYDYTDAFTVLIPGYNLLFIDEGNDHKEGFKHYVADFVDDLSALSGKYKHKRIIGVKRSWENLITSLNIRNFQNFDQYKLKGTNKRKSELLISLITGSINDAERININQPNNILEAIKRRIILFDADQTRFVYNDKTNNKQLTIQGLAGTGKTELLLHKLVDLYIKEPESKIVFTCFNKILANDMLKRIPEFFNFMKADKQIEWDERLWAMRSWGAQASPNSGIYSYICNYYHLPFSRYTPGISFNKLCNNLLLELNELTDFKPCFDYILIDEGQDFDDSFFSLCEKVASKQVIIASDIFQNIFEKNSEITHHPDFTLNKVYRTDPKNFMFAQMIGFGVEERPVINWLSDDTWKTCGYTIKKDASDNVYSFTREPLNRFSDVTTGEDTLPLKLYLESNNNLLDRTLDIISNIIERNVNVKPDDIGIVFLSGGDSMYRLADRLSIKILDKFGWSTQKGYEVKAKNTNNLFISNRNNIKGLEFPFIICVSDDEIQSNPSIRNSLYMALTRSFITSYLVLDDINKPLMDKYTPLYNEIMTSGIAKVTKPKNSEIMNDSDRSILQRQNLTQTQIIDQILSESGISDPNVLSRLKTATSAMLTDKNNNVADIKKIITNLLSMFPGENK